MTITNHTLSAFSNQFRSQAHRVCHESSAAIGRITARGQHQSLPPRILYHRFYLEAPAPPSPPPPPTPTPPPPPPPPLPIVSFQPLPPRRHASHHDRCWVGCERCERTAAVGADLQSCLSRPPARPDRLASANVSISETEENARITLDT